MFPDNFFSYALIVIFHRIRQFMKSIFFWAAVFFMSFFVMLQPARAEGTVSLQSVPVVFPGEVSCSVYPASCSYFVNQSGYPSGIARYYNTNTPKGACSVGVNYGPVGFGFLAACIAAQVTYSCPVNSTGTTTCTCNTGYAPNAGATACVVNTCPVAGTQHSSGYYDVGTNPNIKGGIPTLLACDNGCATQYSGDSIGFRVQVAGVYHYFSQGGYSFTGTSCSAGSASTGAITAMPSVSCSAGQSLVTGANGFKKCYDDMTGLVADGNSASAVAAAQSLASASAASSVSASATVAQAAGLSASAVEAAQSFTVALVTAGGNSGSTGSSGDPVMQNFCKDNPDSSICAEQDFGSVPDTDLGEKLINVSITPVSVGGAGSCPAPSAMVIHGKTYYFDWTMYCNFATGIKPILLAFAWLSAAGLMIGGFKTA